MLRKSGKLRGQNVLYERKSNLQLLYFLIAILTKSLTSLPDETLSAWEATVDVTVERSIIETLVMAIIVT